MLFSRMWNEFLVDLYQNNNRSSYVLEPTYPEQTQVSHHVGALVLQLMGPFTWPSLSLLGPYWTRAMIFDTTTSLSRAPTQIMMV